MQRFHTSHATLWHGLSIEDSAFRRDSRIEIVLAAKPTADMLDTWRNLLRDAANPR